MASRLSRCVRPALLALVAVLGAALALPTLAGASPSPPPRAPQPTIAEVHHQLSELAKKNSQLVESFDRAQSTVTATQQAADKAQLTADAAVRHLSWAGSKLRAGAAAVYEGGSFSATGALLTSESGSSYLDQLDTLSMLSSHNSQMVSDVSAAQQLAKAARVHAGALVVSATQHRDLLGKQRAHVQKQIDKYQVLLHKLNAQQRAAFLAAQSPSVPISKIASATQNLATTPSTGSASGSGSGSGSGTIKGPQPGAGASAAATRAVQFALAQVGKPYVFGAAGPDSYDCSGLTMSAWQAGGVSLPHSAAQQYGYGTHVSFDQMVPGDLLFFYSPIGHVAIYIGKGLMVSAPQTGENVKVIPASSFGSDFVGATHLG